MTDVFTLQPGQTARLADPTANVWMNGLAMPVGVTCPVDELAPGARLVANHPRHGAYATPAVIMVAGPTFDNYGWAPDTDVPTPVVIGQHAAHIGPFVNVFFADGKQRQFHPGAMVDVAGL